VSLVQLLLAAPLALAGADPRYYRLMVIPFAILAGASSWLLAARLGADRFWSAVSGVLLLTSPLALSVLAGFTSDIAFIGLMLAALVVGQWWARAGRGQLLFLVLVVLATVQRQHGLVLPVGMAAALLVARRYRPVPRREWAWLAATLVGVVGALAFPFLSGMATPTQDQVRTGIRGTTVGIVVGAVTLFGPFLSLLVVPLLAGLLRRPDGGDGGWDPIRLVMLVLGAAGIGSVLAWTLFFQAVIWPGNIFGVWGLGPIHLPGAKPPLVPVGAMLALEAVCTVCLAVVLVWRRDLWSIKALGPDGVLLVVVALALIPPIWFTTPLDRYYLGVVAPLVPLLAAAASKLGRAWRWRELAARGWALLAMAGGVAYFVPAQANYVAWQNAVDRAARASYTLVAPLHVQAGYEANGTYVATPTQMATGRSAVEVFNVLVPDPYLALELAPPSDPRPGVPWGSPAPGKVVVVCVAATASCPSPAAIEAAIAQVP
jgi:MFS family permease